MIVFAQSNHPYVWSERIAWAKQKWRGGGGGLKKEEDGEKDWGGGGKKKSRGEREMCVCVYGKVLTFSRFSYLELPVVYPG